MNHHEQTLFPYHCFRFCSFRRRCTACLLLIALLALAAAQFGCSKADGADNFAHIPAAGFFEGLAAGNGMLLDIRTPQEFASGHILGAVLMDYHHPAFGLELATLDRSATYFIYCRTGNRTQQAMSLFKELGFSSVVGLRGGIENWARNGYRVML